MACHAVLTRRRSWAVCRTIREEQLRAHVRRRFQGGVVSGLGDIRQSLREFRTRTLWRPWPSACRCEDALSEKCRDRAFEGQQSPLGCKRQLGGFAKLLLHLCFTIYIHPYRRRLREPPTPPCPFGNAYYAAKRWATFLPSYWAVCSTSRCGNRWRNTCVGGKRERRIRRRRMTRRRRALVALLGLPGSPLGVF